MRFTRYLALAGVAALAVGLGAACSEGDVLTTSEQVHAISVTGQGEAAAAPDTAIVNLGVSVLRDSVAEAIADANTSMDEVLGVLDAAGVEERDVTTANFSVFPEYSFRDEEQQLRGFRVSNQVTAKVRDLDGIGDLLDQVARAAGDDVVINHISFTIDNQTELRQQAREAAVADARARAEELADLAGVELGDVLAVSESGGQRFPTPSPAFFGLGADVAAETAASVPISGGEFTVVVSVSIAYGIE